MILLARCILANDYASSVCNKVLFSFLTWGIHDKLFFITVLLTVAVYAEACPIFRANFNLKQP